MIEELMNQAVADNDALSKKNKLGDLFSVHREVEFYFITKNKEKAEILAEFIQNYAYGNSSIEKKDDEKFGVKVLIYMPIEQNIILSISGFMAVIARMFNAEYAGWESIMKHKCSQ